MSNDDLTFEAVLRDSFTAFIKYVWKEVLRLPAPTRTQLDIAAFLATGPNSRFIQAYRGVGKSFLTCAYVVWRLWNDPQKKVLIVSAAQGAADKNANLIKAIIMHEAGDGLWDGLRPRKDQRSAVSKFDVGPALADRQPSVFCTGIYGQLPNNRADIIIPDDIEIPTNSGTEDQRDKLKEAT